MKLYTAGIRRKYFVDRNEKIIIYSMSQKLVLEISPLFLFSFSLIFIMLELVYLIKLQEDLFNEKNLFFRVSFNKCSVDSL